MIAYLDLPSGLSGDMFLGCLVDAGWPPDHLRHTIERLDLPAGEWAIEVETVQKGALCATHVEVLVEEGRHRRGLADVESIIRRSDLPTAVKDRAVAVFVRLANAEAKVHGTTADQIHFHEVGALDAIVDVVGSVAGLHDLGVVLLYASPVPLGHGWTESAHGRLPLPAPATLELLATAHAPTRPAPGPGELVTPTGAALLAELAKFEQPALSVSRIGTGAGRKDFPWPNVARLWLGEADGSSRLNSGDANSTSANFGDASTAGPIVQLETNIDDMNPQLYPAVSDRLFAAGALDVWLTPVQMKKGRPGVVLSVMGRAADEATLAELILRHTSTLGVRVHRLHGRHEARREMREVQTPYGTVRVKVKGLGTEPVGATPEYDNCRALAEAAGVPVRVVHEAAAAAAQEMLASLCRTASVSVPFP